MTAFMTVSMRISNRGWMGPYAAVVPALLEEHGGRQIAGGLSVEQIEGSGQPPERVAVFAFPDLAAIRAFLEDARYGPLKRLRQQGSHSEILIFEDERPASGFI